jgi:hypothetical protein
MGGRRHTIDRLHPNVLLPGLTALIGFGFTAVLVATFASRRRAYHLVWAIGLLCYALAALSEALGGAFGWTSGLYRVWYITGAIGAAAYLGAGTVYLHREPAFGSLTVVSLLIGCIPSLAGRHVGLGLIGLAAATALTIVLTMRPPWFAHAVVATLLLTSLVAAGRIAVASIDVTLLPLTADEVVSGQAFDANTRALTPPFNITGAAILFLGAALGAVRYWRRRAHANRLASNVLIAVGAFIPSVASGLTRFGVTSVFFVGELLGLGCIVAGFLLSTRSVTHPPSTAKVASHDGRGVESPRVSNGGRTRV